MSYSAADQDLQLAVALIHMRHANADTATSTGSTTTSFTPESTELSKPAPPPSRHPSSSSHSPLSPTRVTSPMHESTPLSPSSNSFHSDNAIVSTPLAKPYSPEERRQAVCRYLAKKHRRRNATDKIRYQIRKKIAHARPRFRGRFSKPPQ